VYKKRLAKFQFKSRSKNLRQMRCSVRNVLHQYGYPGDAVDNIVLALCEACSNVIRHAYGEECSKEMVLEIFHDEQRLMFRLRDFATPIDMDCIKSRKLDDLRPGGLGVHFIYKIMDEVAYARCSEGKGNVLEMTKQIVPTREAG